MDKKVKNNYWPQAIIASILFIIVACGYTIKVALDNPVQMDSSYMTKYQQVDENINELLLAQKSFDKKYRVNTVQDSMVMGKNSLSLNLKDKSNNQAISDAEIKLLVTRPDSEDFDKKPKVISYENGIYTFEEFEIDKIGRWQIIAKITIGENYGYYKNELNATN
jgi:hypothetical protein